MSDPPWWGVKSAWDLNWLCLEEHLLSPGQSDGSLRWARSTRPYSSLGAFPPALQFFLPGQKPRKRMRERTRLLWFGATDQFYLLDHQERNSCFPCPLKRIPNQSCQNVWLPAGIRSWSCWFQAANQDVPASPCGVMLGTYWEEDTSWRN